MKTFTIDKIYSQTPKATKFRGILPYRPKGQMYLCNLQSNAQLVGEEATEDDICEKLFESKTSL